MVESRITDGVCYWKKKPVCEFAGTPGQMEQLDDEHVPEPVPWEEFPIVWAGFSSAEELEDGSLRIDLRTKLDGNADPTRYLVVAKLLMTEPGHTRTGGFYRTFLAISNCTSADAEVRFLIPDFQNLWPVVGPSYQVHCRYLLIDTQTGYRSIFRKTSFLMELG